jgi:hypothetical protein
LVLPHSSVGREGFEPSKVKTNRFTVCPRWPLEYLPYILEPKDSPYKRAGGGIRTPDPLITNQLLWPTELHRQMHISMNYIKNADPLEKGLQIYTLFQLKQEMDVFFHERDSNILKYD